MKKHFVKSIVYGLLCYVVAYVLKVLLFTKGGLIGPQPIKITRVENRWMDPIITLAESILTIIRSFVNGVYDSHVIFIAMIAVYVMYRQSTKTYRERSKDCQSDLDFLKSQGEKNFNPFDLNIEEQIAPKKSLTRINNLRKNLQQAIVSRESARELISTELKDKNQIKNNGTETYSFYQNIIALLGFLGTIFGLILAIGLTVSLFSKTTGEVNTSMSQVAQGLSIAFVTTALSIAFSLVILYSKRKFEGTYDLYIEEYHRHASQWVESQPILTDEQKFKDKVNAVCNELSSTAGQFDSLGKRIGGIFEENISDFEKQIKESVSKIRSTFKDYEL